MRVPFQGKQQESESSCTLCPEDSQEMLSQGGWVLVHLALHTDFIFSCFRSGRGELGSRLQITPVS